MIRPIIPADRDQLLRIVSLQANFLECEVDIAMEVIDGTFDPAEDYRTLAAVEDGGGIAGFISYGPIPLTENRYDLYWIVVDPASGRQGTGSLLLNAACGNKGMPVARPLPALPTVQKVPVDNLKQMECALNGCLSKQPTATP